MRQRIERELRFISWPYTNGTQTHFDSMQITEFSVSAVRRFQSSSASTSPWKLTIEKFQFAPLFSFYLASFYLSFNSISFLYFFFIFPKYSNLTVM